MILGCLVLIICYCRGNIHRTISGNRRNNRYVKHSNDLIEEVDENAGLLDHILYKNGTNLMHSWLFAIPASILVGSTGIFPLFIFNKVNCPTGGKLNECISPGHLRLLLSFSVGGLFGDVFLHLLPEAWMHLPPDDHFAGSRMGLWIIGGLVSFLIIEKIFNIHEGMSAQEDTKKTDGVTKDEVSVEEKKKNSESSVTNGHANGEIKRKMSECMANDVSSTSDKKIVGYLNLLANCIDNFTHGLAVAGSFIVSTPVGVCTTIAILFHEIPHEIGDFAILLSAGFNRWEAAKGQMITASGALLGCLFGLLAEGAGDASAWVLPFTSGSFIYISCATVIPDLLKETNFVESIKQMIALFIGIGLMSLVSVCH